LQRSGKIKVFEINTNKCLHNLFFWFIHEIHSYLLALLSITDDLFYMALYVLLVWVHCYIS
jgi:hypothetical protein